MSHDRMSDDRLDATLAILERLVGFDTESSKSNLPLIADVEAYLAEHEIACIRVANDTGDKAALFATIGPAVDGGVVLSGHTDVVPVAGQAWSSDPFRLRRDGSRLYGRGSCDMKGFDAICLAMVPEFKKAALRRPIHFLFSYDEEITCRGPLDTIARFGKDLPRPGIVLVGEPTLMQVADAHKSIATYHTSVQGHEAHSAKPHLGVSAVEIGCDLVAELYRLARVLEREGDPSGRFDPPFSTIHVGTIQGGTARNILAKQCTLHWEFRGLPGVPAAWALERLDAYVERVVRPKFSGFGDCRIDTIVESEVPGLDPQPGSAAESLVMRLVQSNRTITVPFATEAGQFQRADIPTVVCGPGSIDQAHQPDEFIEIGQIEAGLGFMRRLMAELA